MITKETLKAQIRAMGIEASDTVLIHTSMRAIGAVEGGADTVIDAFCEVLSDGLFLVPTHTWDRVNPAHPVYDVRTAVPCIGALPRVAAFREDGIRSLHPTHSIWAKGRGAEDFVRGEECAESPTPPGFAWARLAEVGAKILLIGVGNNRNTFIHAVDELADLPDRLAPDPYEVTILDREGREYRHPYRAHFCSKSPDVSRQFVNFEKALCTCGAQTFGVLGGAEVRVVDARKCRDLILKIYSRAPKPEELCVAYLDIPEEYYL